jgi:hypothetical protein
MSRELAIFKFAWKVLEFDRPKLEQVVQDLLDHAKYLESPLKCLEWVWLAKDEQITQVEESAKFCRELAGLIRDTFLKAG